MTKIYDRATNPYQYDLPDIDWNLEGAPDQPTRPFHFNYYLFKYLRNLKGKRCLDVGCGTGYLLKELKDRGAQEVVGIEPSKRNFELAKNNFPMFKIKRGTLEKCGFRNLFDIITIVMVFEHIKDPLKAFKKIKSLLKSSGLAYIIVADFDYFQKPKYNYQIIIKKIKENEVVVATKRHYGLLADMIRPLESYTNAARRAGLYLKKHIKMKYTKKMIEAIPRYKESKGLAVTHLLIFGK